MNFINLINQTLVSQDRVIEVHINSIKLNK